MRSNIPFAFSEIWKNGRSYKATIVFRFLFGLDYQTEFLSRRKVYISNDFQWIHFFAERT